MGLRVVFFGTPEFAARVLRGLLDSRHEVAAAACAPDRPSGRGRKVRRGAVSALARERGLPLLQPESLRDPATQGRLRDLGADVFAVASYGLIFPGPALAIPRLAAMNAHASLLPRLRGAAPVERAILGGLDRTGVSIQRMVRRVDAGDVYAARTVSIGPRETAGALRERLSVIAAELMPQVMTDIEAGGAHPVLQDESAVTLAPPLGSRERAICWSEPAEAIDRRVRAFAPRPGAFALLPEGLGAGRIKILESEPYSGDTIRASTSKPARTTPSDERKGTVDRLYRVPGISDAAAAQGEVLVASAREGLVVAAAEGALRVVTVQPEGKRAMDAKAFLRGYRLAAGMCLGDGLSEKRP